MFNDSLVKKTAILLKEVVCFAAPTDIVLSNYFKTNRKLSQKERYILAETIYSILRNYNKLTRLFSLEQAYPLIVLTWLKLLKIDRQELSAVKIASVYNLSQKVLDNSLVELPEWLISKLQLQYGMPFLSEIANAMTKPAVLNLRVNTIKTTVSQFIKQLKDLKIEFSPNYLSPFGITLLQKQALINNELFIKGHCEVQDEASQLAALLLNPKRGEMVVDFCAGSGGKTLVFGMLMKNTGRIYAFDVNERRLNNLSPRLARSGLSNVYPQLISSENDSKIKRLIGKIDKVFVDAPCLGFGTLKRNPDLKFRQKEQDLTEITTKQLAILNSASRLVKSGGYLVYATCSILAEENQAIIESFLSKNDHFQIVPIDESMFMNKYEMLDSKYLILLPNLHNTDGFFACLMQCK